MGAIDRFRGLFGRRDEAAQRARSQRATTRPYTGTASAIPLPDDGFDAPEVEAIARIQLPSLPSSALRAASLARDLDMPSRRIAEAIGLDPALAARVLRAANSPLYSFERSVTTLSRAVTALGNRAVHNLVVVFAASDVMSGKEPLSVDERAIWRHSTSVAFAAREIASELRLRTVEEAFLCGLLHDIGKMLLVRHDRERYDEVLAAGDEREALGRERELYGATHPVVGAAVADRWGLPKTVVRTIACLHRQSTAAPDPTLVHVVDLADTLANAHESGRHVPEALDVGLSEPAMALGLGGDRLGAIWERSEIAALEMTGALGWRR